MAIGHFYGAIKGSLAQQIAGSKSTFDCLPPLPEVATNCSFMFFGHFLGVCGTGASQVL